MSVVLTPSAMEALLRTRDSLPDAAGKSLRVSLKPGGCSGYEYRFDFAAPQEHDVAFPQEGGETLLVDRESLSMLNGAVVDYVSTLMQKGFVITNPNAESTCGCGLSFSPKH